jgi:NAD(P)-dependent dehydrogenase (short-subunit alcohol dehydrogenase family)
MADLAGKRAFITGGGTGIGAAIARELAKAGAEVFIGGRREDVLHKTADEIGLARANCVVLDVTSDASVAAASELLAQADILVNNAGQAASAPFRKSDMAMLDTMLDVNLRGTWRVTQAALPAMTKRGWGRVINIASTAGLRAYPYVAAYVAAKHAVVGLTRALALEVARQGVTVNAVCPGFTETALVDEAVANIVSTTGRDEAAARAELARGNPQGRLVRPEEVASAVLWLARADASAINGQSIAVCGGETM